MKILPVILVAMLLAGCAGMGGMGGTSGASGSGEQMLERENNPDDIYFGA